MFEIEGAEAGRVGTGCNYFDNLVHRAGVISGDEHAQKHAFRSHDAQFFLIDFDTLGGRAEVIAAARPALTSDVAVNGNQTREL
jgi:hypothetical protein